MKKARANQLLDPEKHHTKFTSFCTNLGGTFKSFGGEVRYHSRATLQQECVFQKKSTQILLISSGLLTLLGKKVAFQGYQVALSVVAQLLREVRHCPSNKRKNLSTNCYNNFHLRVPVGLPTPEWNRL